MIRDGQRLALAAGAGTAQLNVASALGDDLKAKLTEDGNDFLAGESFKPWQGEPPIQR